MNKIEITHEKLRNIMPESARIIVSNNGCRIETDYHSPIQILCRDNNLKNGFGLLIKTIQSEVSLLSEFADPLSPTVAWLDFTSFYANDGDIYHIEKFILAELKKYTSLSAVLISFARIDTCQNHKNNFLLIHTPGAINKVESAFFDLKTRENRPFNVYRETIDVKGILSHRIYTGTITFTSHNSLAIPAGYFL